MNQTLAECLAKPGEYIMCLRNRPVFIVVSAAKRMELDVRSWMTWCQVEAK
jgi:hypothetical protein